MFDTTWTCDRCGVINDISDVNIIEYADGLGEIVCKPCQRDEHQEEMARANAEMLALQTASNV